MKKLMYVIFFLICYLNSFAQKEFKCKYIIEGKVKYETFDVEKKIIKLDTTENVLTIPDFDYNKELRFKIGTKEYKPFRGSKVNYEWLYGYEENSMDAYIFVIKDDSIHMFWILNEVDRIEYILSLE